MPRRGREEDDDDADFDYEDAEKGLAYLEQSIKMIEKALENLPESCHPEERLQLVSQLTALRRDVEIFRVDAKTTDKNEPDEKIVPDIKRSRSYLNHSHNDLYKEIVKVPKEYRVDLYKEIEKVEPLAVYMNEGVAEFDIELIAEDSIEPLILWCKNKATTNKE